MENSRKDLCGIGADVAAPLRILDSEELFAGAREVGIRHVEGLYRLSVTRQGKLILTK